LHATEEEAKASYDAKCVELGVEPEGRAKQSSTLRGVSWCQYFGGKWKARIKVEGKMKFLGNFEGSVRGEVHAALAFDQAARALGRHDTANFRPRLLAGRKIGKIVKKQGSSSAHKAMTEGATVSDIERRRAAMSPEFLQLLQRLPRVSPDAVIPSATDGKAAAKDPEPAKRKRNGHSRGPYKKRVAAAAGGSGHYVYGGGRRIWRRAAAAASPSVASLAQSRR
jgi:hypothetical protein